MIQDVCSHSIQTWYLDNDIMIGDLIEVAKALIVFQSEGPKLGLVLNIANIKVFGLLLIHIFIKIGYFSLDLVDLRAVSNFLVEL